ncbi:MAG: hypothetical protein HWE23_07175 [Rhodobacteraceae bacterium]|nr:hypothetical protein [Paracoccaceae bacterium]
MVLATGFAGAAYAGKGDRAPSVQRSSPLLEGRILEVRLADFAQGIWTVDRQTCDGFTTIEEAKNGSAITIFRSLYETPSQICMVYGAEQGKSRAQRAALNCTQNSGGTMLGLLTLRKRGSSVLLVEDGERPQQSYRFCRPVVSVLEQVMAPGQRQD